MALTTTLSTSIASLSLAASSFVGTPVAPAEPVTVSTTPATANVIAPMWIHETFCELIRPIYEGC